MTLPYRGVMLLPNSSNLMRVDLGIPSDSPQFAGLAAMVVSATGVDGMQPCAVAGRYDLIFHPIGSEYPGNPIRDQRDLTTALERAAEGFEPVVLPTGNPTVAQLCLSFWPRPWHLELLRDKLDPRHLRGLCVSSSPVFDGKVIELHMPGLAIKRSGVTLAQLNQVVKELFPWGKPWGN